jgi:hypothetical protein
MALDGTSDVILKFKADTSDAKRGIDDLEQAAKSGAKGWKEAADSTNDAMESLSMSIRSVGKAFAAVDPKSLLAEGTTAMADVSGATANAAMQMKKLIDAGGAWSKLALIGPVVGLGAEIGTVVGNFIAGRREVHSLVTGIQLATMEFEKWKIDRLLEQLATASDALANVKELAIDIKLAQADATIQKWDEEAKQQETMLGQWWAAEQAHHEKRRALYRQEVEELQRMLGSTFAEAARFHKELRQPRPDGYGAVSPEVGGRGPDISGVTGQPQLATGLGGYQFDEASQAFDVSNAFAEQQAETMRTLSEEVEAATAKYEQFGMVAMTAYDMLADSSSSAMDSSRKVIATLVGNLGKQMAIEAVHSAAKGFALLAAKDPAGAALSFKAAAMFGLGAAAAGVTARALNDGGGGSPGGGGSSSTAGAPRVSSGGGGDRDTQTTINIYQGDTLSPSNGRTERNNIARAVRSAHRELEETRGVTFR